MKAPGLTFLLYFTFLATYAQPAFVRLKTTKGDIILRLYDETPKHRDAFLKSINQGLFNRAAFNRVIKGFVSQGGELDETILNREKINPEAPLKRTEAELIPSLYHKKGALGAGRNDNPEKSSYLTQIYLVSGKKITDDQLNLLEQKKGKKFSVQQREVYKTIGGTPHLDGDYTVFGEVVKGMDVAEAINAAATDENDLPLVPVHFTPEILSLL
ncbi:peptidylprolyl isomerase [Pedobacter immunditicola]|uniref:peptidylprolyl isomerase n=1 Tax=Pedobacter immunditicola TaxID=3133440 RepID=UPI0030B4D953